MRIALDGMGGDRAPAVVVEGARLALKEAKGRFEIVLVGRPEELEAELAKGGPVPGGLTVHPASQVAGMEESPSTILRRMKDSSIRVAFDLHKAGMADAVVSAGNSGATMAVGMVVMGRMPHVDRPALASVFPGVRRPTVVVDVGANVDCSPSMLMQFGFMGAAYAEVVLGRENPVVGLMSIGEEDTKGNSAVKQAHELLKNSGLNFIGNLEGRDLFNGRASVVVCDGFVGNVCLKLAEGMASGLKEIFRRRIASAPLAWAGAALMWPWLKKVQRQMDYATYGGAPLLGLMGTALICHGASSPQAMASALRMAADAVEGDLMGKLARSMEKYRGNLLGEEGQE